MWKKTISAIVIGLLLILVLIKILRFLIDLEPIDPANSSICQTEKIVKEEFFKGKLTNKYRDEQNHNYETITISFREINYDSRVFVLEESGLFDSLVIGDSLFKEAGSLQIIIKSADQISEVDLMYNCKD